MAARYFLNIGANWGDTANWSDTSGGAGGFSVPTNADDVIFDVNSGNATVNVDGNSKTIDFTNYASAITMSSGITISGDTTLGSGMTISGSGNLKFIGTSTLTSNGKTWPNELTFAVTSGVYTLADNWVVTGALNFTHISTMNSNSITFGGNLNFTGSASCIGTSNFIFNGTGTWSGNNLLRNNFEINTSGTLTVSGTVQYNNGNLKYTSGTVITAGSTLNLIGGGSGVVSLETSAVTWNNITFGNSLVVTLLGDLNIDNDFLATSNGYLTINGVGLNVYVGGNFTLNTLNSTVTISGTAKFILNGTGTWSGVANLRNSVEINTSGTITISGTIYFQGTNNNSITYIAGTVITTGSTLSVSIINLSVELDTDGIVWNNLTLTTTGFLTYNFTSDFTMTGNFTANINFFTFNGATIYVGGNYSTGQPTPGSATIVMNGTGSQSIGLFTDFGNSFIINKPSGTLTFDMPTLTIRSASTDKVFQYISGDVVFQVGMLLRIIASVTLDIPSSWVFNRFTTDGNTTLVLINDLHISGICSIGASSQPFVMNGADLYVYDTLTSGGGNGQLISGNSKIRIVGDVCKFISNPIVPFPFNCRWGIHIIINVKTVCYLIGKIRYEGTTFEILSGNVVGKRLQNTLNALLPVFDKSGINFTTSCTLTNFDKLNVEDIVVTSGANLTMNKFFGGSPKMQTRVRATNEAINYNILFSSTEEKLVKFVKVSNATINNNSLLVLTDNGNKGRNVGLKYINQLPNGIYKQTLSKQSTPDFLVTDPNFITK